MGPDPRYTAVPTFKIDLEELVKALEGEIEILQQILRSLQSRSPLFRDRPA